MAAGQEQKKTLPAHKTSKMQAGHLHHHKDPQSHSSQKQPQQQQQQQQHHQQQQQPHHHPQQQSSKTSQPMNKPTQHLPSQLKSQTIPMVQPQKPAVTVSTVQPKTATTHTPTTTASSTTSTLLQKTPSLPTRPSINEQIKSKLPQLPPRVQSQGSVTTRGPPPAIPPRNNVSTPAPVRSSSIQASSANVLNRPALMRQTSANSIPPQYTPQQPPKFVIPQRQNSRTSMITGPHVATNDRDESGSSTEQQQQHQQQPEQFQRRH